MRTTLAIDDDLGRQLEQLRAERDASIKQIVNEALRIGLAQMQRGPVHREPYRTRSVSLGRPRLPDVDNVAEALAIAEGDPYR